MRAEKKDMVKELVAEIKNANPLVFTKYAGIKVNNMTELRSRLTQVNAKYRIIQNRLFKKAMEDIGITNVPLEIKGPFAVAYGGKDVVEVVRTLINYTKDNPDIIVIKGGLIDNNYLDSSNIEVLSKLPSKEVLIGRLVSQIGAPLTRFAMVMQGSIQKLLCALDGIAKKKQ